MQSRELLDRLIRYPTVSRDSNLELIRFIKSFLEASGFSAELIYNKEKTKANLYSIIGPAGKPGVMLSGHTDVVPVEGQNWSSDPFTMREHNGNLYGRGSCDMKGFIASVLSAVSTVDAASLKTPLHLAFSYDEEIGCIGVRRLIDTLKPVEVKPSLCVVGEPTLMQPIIAHKGKTAARAHCHGIEGHSSLAPQSVNAIYLATELINSIRKIQQNIIDHGHHDHDYDVSHTTLHVGTISGDPTVNIELEITNEYPALNTAPESEIVAFIKKLTGANTLGKIAFGTEGGLFSRDLGVETIVFGPGSIEQAHKPDEYLSIDQLERCDAFLHKLISALRSGCRLCTQPLPYIQTTAGCKNSFL